ncbi:MAG TPA: ABC transporter permease subunit [Micromonosporaceae bacterium]|jgi:hypothetical protein|nr:ABC transporter permease subunit [Micromonosporaceae bacterium]
MLWLAWRQHRLQFLAVAAVLAALAVYLIHITLPMVGPTRLYQTCVTLDTDAACEPWNEIWSRFVGERSDLTQVIALANVLPGLAGAFWGAPLIAREFERGTHRLAWTQGVTRLRWLTVKLVVLACAAVLGGTAQAVLMTWVADNWRINQTINRFNDRILFDAVGVVPPALWLFSVALGTAVGLVIRRTTAAMAVTLAALALVLIGLNFARPHYATPATRVPVYGQEGRDMYRITEEWRQGYLIRDRDGKAISSWEANALCPAMTGADEAVRDCLIGQGGQMLERYQPADRFARFQWTENGILLAGTVLIGGLTIGRLRRRAD